MNDTLRNGSLRNKKGRISAQELEIINFHDLEVTSSPTKKAESERSTTTSKVPTKRDRKSSGGSHFQQRSKTTANEPPATAYVVKKIIKEAKIFPEYTLWSPEVVSKLTVYPALLTVIEKPYCRTVASY